MLDDRRHKSFIVHCQVENDFLWLSGKFASWWQNRGWMDMIAGQR